MVALFFISFIFFVLKAAPSITAGDSGELVTAAFTLGIPHPPGYPLWTVIARIFSLVPLGNPAYRVNLVSAFFASLTVAIIYKIVQSSEFRVHRNLRLSFLFTPLCRSRAGQESMTESNVANSKTSPFAVAFRLHFIAGIAAVLTALSVSFFRTATVTEVFSLHLFLSCLIIYFLLYSQKSFITRIFISAFFTGLALGNHHTIIFILPGIALYIFLQFKRRLKPAATENSPLIKGDQGGCSRSLLDLSLRHFHIAGRACSPILCTLHFALCAAIGLSIHLYLPFRAVNNPALNWGSPDSPKRLYDVLTRAQYGSTKLHPDDSVKRNPEMVFGQVKQYLSGLYQNTGFFLLLAGIAALIILKGADRVFYLSGFALTGVFFFLLANLPPELKSAVTLDRFFAFNIIFLILPVFLIFKNKILLTGFLLLSVVFLPDKIAHSDFRNDFTVYRCGKNMLQKPLRNSAVIFDENMGDDIVFSAVYIYDALNYRKDLELIDSNGNLFRNVYGRDYISLDKVAMRARRKPFERRLLARPFPPVYVIAINKDNYEGVPLSIAGEFYIAGRYPVPKVFRENIYLNQPGEIFIPKHFSYRNRQFLILSDYFILKDKIESGQEYKKNMGSITVKGRDFEWLFYNLGSIFLHQGILNEAKTSYEKALEIKPDYAEAYYGLGYLDYSAGLFAPAKEKFQKAIALKNNFADAHFNLGVVYSEEGNIIKAKELLNRYIILKPDGLNRRQVDEWLASH